MPSQSLLPGIGNVPIRRDPTVVLIRHGKTEHNILGLFTGEFEEIHRILSSDAPTNTYIFRLGRCSFSERR